MRRVLIGGLAGAAPGALIIGGAFLLASLDVITSDQSQIAFLGIPFLAIGLLVGLLAPAVRQGIGGQVVAGMGLGLAAGIAATIAMTTVSPGFWLWLVPVTMLGGAVVGAWWAEHHSHPTGTTPQHEVTPPEERQEEHQPS